MSRIFVPYNVDLPVKAEVIARVSSPTLIATQTQKTVAEGKVNSKMVYGDAPKIPVVSSVATTPVIAIETFKDITIAQYDLGKSSLVDIRAFTGALDYFKSSDVVYVAATFNRVLLNTLSYQEFISNAIGKKLVDNANVSQDKLNIEVEKRLADNFKYNDSVILRLTIIRFFEDIYQTAEEAILSFNKGLIDSTIPSDTIDLLAEFKRTTLDFISNSELVVFNTEKELQEIPTATDILDRIVEYYRSIEDTMRGSDDIFGLADIDDAQYASMFKVTNETLFVPEVLSFDVTTKLIAIYNANDSAAITLDKSFSNSIKENDISYITFDQVHNSNINSLDPRYLKIGKTVSELLTHSHELYFYSVKGVNTLYRSIEEASFDLVKPIQNNSLLTDIISLKFDALRLFIESISSKERITLSVTKSIENTFNSIDLITIQLTLNRYLSEVFNTSELLLFSVDKGLIDIAKSTDSITIQMGVVRLLYTAFVYSDTVSLSPNKAVISSLSYSEESFRTINKSIIDTLLVSDNILGNDDPLQSESFTVEKDFPKLLDTFSAEFNKILSSLFTYSDQFLLGFNKGVHDTSQTADITAKTFYKVIVDTIYSIDIFTGTISPERTPTDTGKISDKVIINVQSYFVDGYVEPGFIGIDYNTY
jgi:hypothetical protein